MAGKREEDIGSGIARSFAIAPLLGGAPARHSPDRIKERIPLGDMGARCRVERIDISLLAAAREVRSDARNTLHIVIAIAAAADDGRVFMLTGLDRYPAVRQLEEVALRSPIQR